MHVLSLSFIVISPITSHNLFSQLSVGLFTLKQFFFHQKKIFTLPSNLYFNTYMHTRRDYY